jgi:DNA repair protein RecN (Recombination protein N)
MLTTLRIQNLAIVDALEVELAPGLNVVTGETGAGKSILVDALQLVLGGRAQAEAVRAGADEAVVEAHFAGPGLDARLEALGLPAAEGELVVRRVVARSGRGRVTLNGAISTVGMLAQVGRGLVDLSGQHEHVALLDAGNHLALLDAFAGAGELLEGQAAKHRALQAARGALAGLQLDESERVRRSDYLAYQVRELEALDARAGEEAELAAERKRLSAVERLRAAGLAAHELLMGSEGALERAARAQARAGEAAALDGALGPVADGLRAGLAELDEAARSLSRYLDALSAQPERLLEVEGRLEQLRHQARKHGCTPDALLARLEAARAELAALVQHEARRSELEADVARADAEARGHAAQLARLRRSAAHRFAQAVRRELAQLAMPQTRFEVSIDEGELGATGTDRVELLIGPNPGEPLLPLAKVASGGELSRALLGIKRALAGADPVETYVFDEVDAGIGGAVAAAVGRTLQAVAAHRQVLCVTHLPQVAAFADHHLVVCKTVQRGRTVSAVRALRGLGERESELARMLGGEEVGAAARGHAAQLLSGAQRKDEAGVVRRAGRRAARRVHA